MATLPSAAVQKLRAKQAFVILHIAQKPHGNVSAPDIDSQAFCKADEVAAAIAARGENARHNLSAFFRSKGCDVSLDWNYTAGKRMKNIDVIVVSGPLVDKLVPGANLTMK